MTYRDDFGRDNRGRWKKGFCPNRKGRPRKEPAISGSDVGWFKQQVVEVTINGEKRKLTRHELLLRSMFDLAIKGKSVLARKLFDRFENVDTTWAQARETLKEDRDAFLRDYHDTGRFDNERARKILELQGLLDHGQKPTPQRKARVRRKQGFANFRKGPKPQSLLDLERKEDEEIRAKERERARRLGLPLESDDDDNDNDEGPDELC